MPASNSDEQFRELEIVLLWEGAISNERVRGLFGVKQVRASYILKAYTDAYPGYMVRDQGAGRGKYLAGPDLAPTLSKGVASEYLSLLQHSPATKALVLDGRPDLACVDPRTFSLVNQAVLKSAGIRLTYHSMSRPNGSVRIIAPHTIVIIGRRWHARAWCCEREEFRDFNLGRMRDLHLVDDLDSPGRDDDQDWNETITIRLAPHRELSDGQRAVVKMEMLGDGEFKDFEVKRSLAMYVLNELEVATDVRQHLPPRYQLELANRDEIDQALPGFPW